MAHLIIRRATPRRGPSAVLLLLLGVVATAGILGSARQTEARTETAALDSLRDDVQEMRYLDADVRGWQGDIVTEEQ